MSKETDCIPDMVEELLHEMSRVVQAKEARKVDSGETGGVGKYGKPCTLQACICQVESFRWREKCSGP